MLGTFSAVAVYLALSILLNLALSARVIQLRLATRTRGGHGGHETLEWAIRAHANNSEYAPFAMSGLIFLALLDCPPVLAHAIGISYIVGRCVSAWGLGWNLGRGRARQIGMGLTALALLTTAITLIVLASELGT